MTAREIRLKLGLSQREFSERYGVPLGTLRNWEQDRYEPDTVHRICLSMICSYPKLVAVEVQYMREDGQL
jgi:putative transcriptional regulator